MELRSAITDTHGIEVEKTTGFNYRWMHHFFSEDVSLKNQPVVEMQRRAIWIGIAFILQGLNEIPFSTFMPFGAMVQFFLILSSFFAIWQAFRPARQKQQAAYRRPARRWQRFVLLLTIVLAALGSILFGRGLVLSFLPPQFGNDGTSLDTNAAILLLQGRNPYTDSNMLDLARRFPIQPDWTTPLRKGEFANRLNYPTLTELQSVLDTDMKAGSAPEFESKVSYPALSFLTLVPFTLVKGYNTLPFFILSYLALIFVAWKVIRPELRPWLILLSLANIPMWSSTVGGNLDVFYTLLIVLVWLCRGKRWQSAALLGLAIASKQIAWFFTPYYLIMVWRTYGFKEAVYRGIIAGGVALAVNLPFIIWNAHAWFSGVMAPMADPMFPLGVGVIALSTSHLIPYLPQTVYTLLELVGIIACLGVYWRICRKYPEAAMLLGVIPLFFAWRSLSSYFYCVAYPLFILLAIRLQADYKQKKLLAQRAEAPDEALPLHATV
ncbi:MAG TPA: glycosyltransferase 87 family protein [Ktedonobacteraceae bacterium]|jgi:uncharacterized membrane protein|nr:glycosyltransferase 87 family protein [Ktedonobacteraceae bacterium]